MTERADGFYWIKVASGPWEVGEHQGGDWYRCGSDVAGTEAPEEWNSIVVTEVRGPLNPPAV